MKEKARKIWKKSKIIRPLYWWLYRLIISDFIRRIARNRRLDKTLPALYREGAKKKVNPRKVVFVELRQKVITNSFQELYKALEADKRYDVHVHFLEHKRVKHRIYVQRCLEMVKDIADARCVFLNEASEEISALPMRRETVVMQTWHACGAFKRFGSSTLELKFGPDAKEMKRHPLNRNYTHVAVSSPEVVWAYEEAMELKDSPGVVTPVGISRTDIFFAENEKEKAFERFYKQFPAAEGKKVILYAPTFRGTVTNAEAPKGFDIEKFYESLGDSYVVVVKQHPHIKELPPVPRKLEGSFARDVTKTMSIEDLLFVSDIVISDYSSLVFEYSLFNRPMLFYAYDLEDYDDWRGFYYPYEEMTPGPVCRTNEEMIAYIRALPESFDQEKVTAFREKFMSACDGHATERILKLCSLD